jgi:hypothetical protein
MPALVGLGGRLVPFEGALQKRPANSTSITTQAFKERPEYRKTDEGRDIEQDEHNLFIDPGHITPHGVLRSNTKR